ncbi:MAG: outer membrane beta-barrel protein [Thermodesulfobacteriota bacterium]
MKKIILSMICGLLLVFPAMSLAASLYGSVGVGPAWVSDSDVSVDGFFDGTAEFDTGYFVGAAVGYMREPFRLDAELSYMASDMDTYAGFPADAEIDALTFLANGYYDFNTGGPMKPYITAGIGASTIEISEPGFSDEDDTVFAYQVGFGVGYELSETLILDCRYRFMSGQDMEFSAGGSTVEVEIASHNLTVGVRIPFY